VGLRYLRPRRRHFLISVLTVIATTGVIVAVAAPQITLSVMNGFETEVRRRVVNTNYHVIVLSREQLSARDSVQAVVAARPDVEAVSPFVRREAVLTFGGGGLSQRFHGCIVLGVDPAKEERVTRVVQAIMPPPFVGFHTDLFDDVDGRHFPGIVLGHELAREVGASLGDVVSLAAATGDGDAVRSLDDLQWRPRSFRVVGFLNSGFYEFDSQLAFVDLAEAQDFFGLGDHIYGIGVRVRDYLEADRVAAQIDDQLGIRYYTNNWIHMFRNVFTWMETERKLMFLLFVLIISIAVITVVGMLTMIVMEKRKSIGILKSMGASRSGIMGIFVIHGSIIGALGAVVGSGVGWLGCQLVDRIGIELPGDVYIIDSLPVAMRFEDFAGVAAAAVLLCFLATLYPSWEAARLDPTEAIRYE
jgi:lipoprotein-releasing system permease protein